MSEGLVRVSIGAVAAVNLAIGLFAGIAPGSFYEEIGTYGVENGHFIGDIAGAYLAIGVGLLISVFRPPWRVPALTITALWWALHALNHLEDIDEASSHGKGVADTVMIALGAAAIGVLAWVVARRRTGEESG